MARALFISIFLSVLSSTAFSQSYGVYQLHVQENGESVELAWRSLQGMNIVLYEIHKLNENNDWVLVQSLDNDSDVEHWRIEDSHPVNGLNSYRLKALEINGAPHYSDVKEVFFQPVQFDVMVYPNPANNWIVVNADRKNVSFRAELINKYGSPVATSEAKNGSLVIDTSEVIEGLYYVRINGGSINYNKTVVINHR